MPLLPTVPRKSTARQFAFIMRMFLKKLMEVHGPENAMNET
jgi:hypothetical protein